METLALMSATAAVAAGLIAGWLWYRTRRWPTVVWLHGRVSASLDRDDAHLRIGQFLRLRQDVPLGTSGWTESKFNLPESWRVTSVEVLEHAVRIAVESSGTFEIGARNFGRLSHEILTAPASDDAVLEDIWRRYAWLGANNSFKPNLLRKSA